MTQGKCLNSLEVKRQIRRFREVGNPYWNWYYAYALRRVRTRTQRRLADKPNGWLTAAIFSERQQQRGSVTQATLMQRQRCRGLGTQPVGLERFPNDARLILKASHISECHEVRHNLSSRRHTQSVSLMYYVRYLPTEYPRS